MQKNESIAIEDIDYLNDTIKKILLDNGIKYLRKFQEKALRFGLNGKNLVISAPTGSGKTLVGEILALYRVLNFKEKVFFLVPYKALAEELYETMKNRYTILHVGISTGDYKDIPSQQLGIMYDLIVMTYEKADMLLREYPSWMKRVRLFVIDEIHLIDDIERGAILDGLITRLKKENVQIIALSATIVNAKDLANWMNAELIVSNIRPVKLLEGVYYAEGEKLYFYDPEPEKEEYIVIESRSHNTKSKEKSEKASQMTLLDFISRDIQKELNQKISPSIKITKIVAKKILPFERQYKKDEIVHELQRTFKNRIGKGILFYEEVRRPHIRERTLMRYILDLVYDTLYKSRELGTSWQILIFRRSRQLSQKTAEKISSMLSKMKLTDIFPEAEAISHELLKQVDEISPLTDALANVIRNGVAFHHAGLTREERKIVEKAFRERKIGVIVATPTLGAGINLPARRVVIEHLVYDSFYGMRRISVSKYKQRAGRAGRPGFDYVGEAVLIAKNEDEIFELFDYYIFGNPEPITSKLGAYLPELRKQLLATIVASGKNGITLEDIFNFFFGTFYAWQSQRVNDFVALHQLRENILKGVNDLIRWDYIKEKDGKYVASRLGRRVSLLYIDPLTARFIVNYLKTAKTTKNILPDEFFYVLANTPDLESFKLRLLADVQKLARYILAQYYEFREEMQHIITNDRLKLIKMLATGSGFSLLPEEEEELAGIGLVSILIQWINAKRIQNILEPLSPRFGGGDLRELTSRVEWLLYCSRELGSTLRLNISLLRSIDILRQRVSYGVTKDLLDIIRIPGIGRVRALLLKNYGYDSIEKLSRASISSLIAIPGIGETLAHKIIEYARSHSSD